MHIAIDRVQDETLIPQKEKWTVEIYKALAHEFKELNQYRNTIEVSELILQKWPMRPRRAGGAEPDRRDLRHASRRQSARGHGGARGELAPRRSRRAPSSPTTSATRRGSTREQGRPGGDPDRRASRPRRPAPRRSRSHQRRPRARSKQALAASATRPTRDPDVRARARRVQARGPGLGGLPRAGRERARRVREPLLARRRQPHDRRASRSRSSDRRPSNEVEEARQTAVAVRDSNEDDKYLQPAAFFVVDIAHQALQRPVQACTSARTARRASSSATASRSRTRGPTPRAW